MAYLDFADSAQASTTRIGNWTVPARPAVAPAVSFSAIEWSVVALAKRDGPRSLAEPGRLMTAVRTILGKAPDIRLADPRLEALRRTAVLAWHWGKRLPASEIAAFHEAGFTRVQLDTLMHSLELDHAARSNGRLA